MSKIIRYALLIFSIVSLIALSAHADIGTDIINNIWNSTNYISVLYGLPGQYDPHNNNDLTLLNVLSGMVALNPNNPQYFAGYILDNNLNPQAMQIQQFPTVDNLKSALGNNTAVINNLGWQNGSATIQTLFGSGFASYNYVFQAGQLPPPAISILPSTILGNTDPGTATDNLNHAAGFLGDLQNASGALAAFNDLTGQSLPISGQSLTLDQNTFLINQLYAADGSKTLAYTDPASAATNDEHADTYLKALRQTSGALSALQDLTGQTLPGSGSLSANQIVFLFEQLFDKNGNQTVAYTNPTAAAQTLPHADAYLQALRNTSGALSALQDLTGIALSGSGALTVSQLNSLFGQLYNMNGSQSLAYTNPTAAAQALPRADAYLQALRNTRGALTALADLTGQTLPTSGPLNSNQIQFLFQQLFNKDGSQTTAYKDPKAAAQGLLHLEAYLKALCATPDALKALFDLTGEKIPASGPLNNQQIQFMYSQLFDSKGATLAYFNPTLAAENLPHGDAYLQALRNTQGALTALTDLTGQTLAGSGSLSASQIAFLFEQLFDKNGNQTVAYNNPTAAAQALSHANAYLQILRQTGGLALLNGLTGQSLPASGPLLNVDQLTFLFQQLFEKDGKTTTFAYTNPRLAATYLEHAVTYLNVLRQTPGALEALYMVTGQSLPASGPLTSDQIQFLFTLIFDANGNPTEAYYNPQGAVEALLKLTTHLHVNPLLIGLAIGATIALVFAARNLSVFPFYGWIALGVLVLSILLLIRGKKVNQPLGNGDVPVFAASNSTLAGASLSIHGGASLGGSPSQTNVGSAPMFSQISDDAQNSEIVGSVSVNDFAGHTEVIGSQAPNQSYRSFYWPTGQGPTGLTPDVNTEIAVGYQNQWLTTATSGHPIVAAQTTVTKAAVLSKNIAILQTTGN